MGARAVGTRRGDGPSRGLASKADGAGWQRKIQSVRLTIRAGKFLAFLRWESSALSRKPNRDSLRARLAALWAARLSQEETGPYNRPTAHTLGYKLD